MKEQDIILGLANHHDHMTRYELMLPNVFIQHDSEADLFCIRKSGLCDEFEVKTSRSDFLADKKKFIQFREMTNEEWLEIHKGKGGIWSERVNWPNYKSKQQALADGNMCINYFWYAIVEGIAALYEIPEFAGVITFSEDGRLNIRRSPKKLHGNKMPIEDRYKIARKSTYRFWKLKNQMTPTT